MGADLERAGLVVVGVTDSRPVVALHDPRLLSVAHLLPEAARAPVDPRAVVDDLAAVGVAGGQVLLERLG